MYTIQTKSVRHHLTCVPLFVSNAAERLKRLPIEKIYVSDSVQGPERFPLPLQVSSLAPLLGETIQRLYRLESLGEVLAHE